MKSRMVRKMLKKLQKTMQVDEKPVHMEGCKAEAMEVVKTGNEKEAEEEERIRMEIMLGMVQEKGVPCLLCLMPKCLCHLTLELTKLESKSRILEGGEEAPRQEPPDEDGLEVEKAVDKGVLEDGHLGGPLEGEGLTSNEEGPAGDPESLHTLISDKNEEGEATSAIELDRKEAEEEVDGRQEPDLDLEKVKNTELLIQMRKRMKLAKKQEEKKIKAQKKKEVDRRKEDKKQATSSRNVEEMLKMWSKDGGEKSSSPGNIPLKIDLVRKLPGREQERNLPGTSEEVTVPDERRGQEEGRKSQELLIGNKKTSIKTGIIEKIFDRKNCEDRKQGEEGSKEDPGRKRSKEGENPGAKSRNRKPGTSGSDEPRLKITDLIRNYSSWAKAARNNKEERDRSRR